MRNKSLIVKNTNNSLEAAYNDWDDNDSTTKVTKPLTLEEKAEKFKKAIDKLHKTDNSINIFAYETNNQDNQDINFVICQKELLHELKIKNGIEFTIEEFKVKVEIIEQTEELNEVKIEICSKDDRLKKISKIITANIKKQSNNKILVSLLKAKILNLSLMEIKLNFNKKTDLTIKDEIEKIKKLKEDYLKLTNEESELYNISNLIEENTKESFEKKKQEIFNTLVEKIKIVNTIQQISYFQKKLGFSQHLCDKI